MISYNITPAQDITESLNIQAAMWANKVLTRKITNQQCKLEVAQQLPEKDFGDMLTRIRKYLNAGLVTEATFKTPAQEQIERIKQQAKMPPVATQSTTGSSDGLWSTNVRGKR
jgi:hypothetical protein